MAESGPISLATSGGYRLLNGLLLILVLLVAGLLGWHSLTDLDIWFHLRAGQDLLAGNGFPQINTYAFTDPEHPWLNHEWLFQALTAWTAPAAPLQSGEAIGWNVLRLLLILTITSLLALGDGNLKRLRSGSSPLTTSLTALVVLVGLFLLWPRFNLRPELFSYVFFVLLVRGADAHYRRPAPQNIWQDPSLWRLGALIVIWAQCHGFAAIGPIVLLLKVLALPLERANAKAGNKSPAWGPLATWAPVMLGLVALMLTPNLWRGLLFPIRALSQLNAETADLSQTVSELVPLLKTANSLNLTLISFKAALAWGVAFAVLGWGRVSVLRVLLFGLTAAAAVASQRNIAIFGLAFVLLHTGSRGNGLNPWWQQKLRLVGRPKISPTGPLLILAVLVISTVAWWAPRIVSNDFYLSEGVGRRFGAGSTPATYPRAAARQLTAPQGQRTFANLDAAAFLLGTTEAKLFIDGRTEAYPKTRWAQYGQVRGSGPAALNLLMRNEVSAVVLALSSGAFRDLARDLMASETWHVAAADAGGVLFLTGSRDAIRSVPHLLSEAGEALLATPDTDPTRQADLCLAASDLFQLDGNPAAARRTLALGLEVRPEHPNLNHNLGNLLLAEGDYSGARKHFVQALEKNPRLAGSALNAGVCHLRLQQPEAAVKSFRRALGIDPNQVGGWVNLAVALRGLGQHDDAVSALEKALALRPGDARLQGQLQQWRRADQ